MSRITDDTIVALKTTLIATMERENIDSITIEYGGSGDEGTINDITYVPSLTSVPTIVFDADAIPLDDFVYEFANALIESNHAGYQDNEGGHGTITVTRKPARVSWTHSDFYVERLSSRYTV